MIQIAAIWQLWGLRGQLEEEANAIQLRGYNRDAPIPLPAEFYSIPEEDDYELPKLSVAQIASGYCPTKRDIYLEKRLGVTKSTTHKTWGRIAGHIIEDYFKSVVGFFEGVAAKPCSLDFAGTQAQAEQYSAWFWESRKGKLQQLEELAQTEAEDPSRLVFVLQQATRHQLALLKGDYGLRQRFGRRFNPLHEEIPISFSGETLSIRPNSRLGLSEITTPDFIVMGAEVVLGEVKTGDRIRKYHLSTVAGYALAYESQHEVDVNFGIVYFFETHVRRMSFPQVYVFLIDDFQRKSFIDLRDTAYAAIAREEPPQLADYEKYCQFCKYQNECYPGNSD